MVCSLRSDNSFGLTQPEVILATRKTLGQSIAHKGGRRRTAGRDAHPATDGAAAQERYPIARQGFDGFEDIAYLDPSIDSVESKPLFHGEHELSNAEETDDSD